LQGGYDVESERASRYLKEGIEYTVEKTTVHSWSTDVYLKEIPGIIFNSSHFFQKGYDDVKEPEAESTLSRSDAIKLVDNTITVLNTLKGFITKDHLVRLINICNEKGGFTEEDESEAINLLKDTA
jgi:hypothetical protein